MKNNYMDYLVKTDFPKRWNENVKAQTMMDKNKEFYNTVKKVTDQFI